MPKGVYIQDKNINKKKAKYASCYSDRKVNSGYLCSSCSSFYRYWKMRNNKNLEAKHIIKERNYHLKYKYKITLEDYNKLYEEQEGRCAICRKHYEKLLIDHDHNTNQIRGLLCNKCNLGLGHFKDFSGYLLRAIEYLDIASANAAD